MKHTIRFAVAPRYRWFVAARDNAETLDLGGTVLVDYRTGRLRQWDPGPTRHAGEGEGWLLTLVYDRAAGTSDLCMLDALRPDHGPMAEIRLPRRVPHGFHATWIPA